MEIRYFLFPSNDNLLHHLLTKKKHLYILHRVSKKVCKVSSNMKEPFLLLGNKKYQITNAQFNCYVKAAS